jgi:hypothetical protein
VPAAFHVCAVTFVAVCFWLAVKRPESYHDAMQEDRLVEWLSALAYASAGVLMLRRAVRERRVFDGLVAFFLLFVAGEEMSWGQRLLGLTPPAYFLEHNTQQEMNVHNFAEVFGGPKGPFTLILIGYAVLMPIVALVPRGQRLLDRVGATPPPLGAIPWFLAAIALFMWYPVSFTGEWNELLAGATFVVAARPRPAALAVLLPLGILGALWLTRLSSRGVGDPAALACARAEVRAIAAALNPAVLGTTPSHRRVWTYVRDERIEVDTLRARLSAASCIGPEHGQRRRFAVDPWGTAYWMRVSRMTDGVMIVVYSFGPNRRRDAEDAPARDDVAFRQLLATP